MTKKKKNTTGAGTVAVTGDAAATTAGAAAAAAPAVAEAAAATDNSAAAIDAAATADAAEPVVRSTRAKQRIEQHLSRPPSPPPIVRPPLLAAPATPPPAPAAAAAAAAQPPAAAVVVSTTPAKTFTCPACGTEFDNAKRYAAHRSNRRCPAMAAAAGGGGAGATTNSSKSKSKRKSAPESSASAPPPLVAAAAADATADTPNKRRKHAAAVTAPAATTTAAAMDDEPPAPASAPAPKSKLKSKSKGAIAAVAPTSPPPASPAASGELRRSHKRKPAAPASPAAAPAPAAVLASAAAPRTPTKAVKPQPQTPTKSKQSAAASAKSPVKPTPAAASAKKRGSAAAAAAASSLPVPSTAAPLCGSSEDRNDDICGMCNDGGDLVMCESCPKSYHPDCLSAKTEWVDAGADDDTPFHCVDADLECDNPLRPVYRQHAYTAKDAHVQWIGAGVKRGGALNTNTYYDSFSIDGDPYVVGDFIVTPADDNDQSQVLFAELLEMWEDCYGKKWMNGRWYSRPEDTKGGRQPWHGANELFQTTHCDENYLGSVDGHCYILTEAEYKRGTHSHSPEFTYFVRQRYDDHTGEFFTLRPDRHFKQKPAPTPTATAAAAASPSKPKKSPAPKSSSASSSSSSAVTASPSKQPKPKSSPAKPKQSTSGAAGSAAAGGPIAIPAPVRAARAAAQPSAAGDSTPGDVYGRAVASLQLSSVPASLPCRQTEHDAVYRFLKGAIQHGGLSNSLLIGGMPGTGKTATVLQCIRELWNEHEKGTLPPFQFVEINGMKLPDPHQAYTTLWKALSGKHASAKAAAMHLTKLFSTANSKRPCCVVLLDEMDFILTAKQDVLYNLFDWPGKKFSKLCVVGISNTLDLAERLTPRVQSRLAPKRIIFGAYTVNQIYEILRTRLDQLHVVVDDSDSDNDEPSAAAAAAGGGDAKDAPKKKARTKLSPVMEAPAIELIARRVAGRQGDIRRALQVSRRAIELCMRGMRSAAAVAATAAVQPAAAAASMSSSSSTAAAAAAAALIRRPVVTTEHVELAVQEAESQPHIAAIRKSSKHEKILFWSAYRERELNAVSGVLSFARLADRHITTCTRKGITPAPTPNQLLQLCIRLSELNLFDLDVKRDALNPTIRLPYHHSDIRFALADDAVWITLTTHGAMGDSSNDAASTSSSTAAAAAASNGNHT